MLIYKKFVSLFWQKEALVSAYLKKHREGMHHYVLSSLLPGRILYTLKIVFSVDYEKKSPSFDEPFVYDEFVTYYTAYHCISRLPSDDSLIALQSQHP